MPTKTLLLDTCFFIEHLRKNAPETQLIFKQISQGNFSAGFSIITDVELWAGVKNSADERRHKILLRDLSRYPLTVSISHLAGKLLYTHRKQGLGPGDAIIAATALRHNLTVCTRNVRHFNFIPGLAINPY